MLHVCIQFQCVLLASCNQFGQCQGYVQEHNSFFVVSCRLCVRKPHRGTITGPAPRWRTGSLGGWSPRPSPSTYTAWWKTGATPMISRNPHLFWGLQLLLGATRSVCKVTWGQLVYARAQYLSGDHGDRKDMHDFCGSFHMPWGLQLVLGVTWWVLLQKTIPQPLRGVTQHSTDDNLRCSLNFIKQSQGQWHADHDACCNSWQSKLVSQVMEVDVDMLTCQVTEGLTEDAVSARLHQGGLVPPLYLHSSIHARQDRQISESTVEAEWEQRVSQLFRSQVSQSAWLRLEGPILKFEFKFNFKLNLNSS